MSRRRRNSELRRRKPQREPRHRILIVCEGKRTEPGYFDALRVKFRAVVDLEVEPGGATPKKLVELALARKKEAKRAARSQRDRFLRYDEVWCVFDTDEHPYLADARQQALTHGIDLAVSNPCFELWALLHFQEQSAYLGRQAARARLKSHLPHYQKALPFEKLDPRYTTAVIRARELDRRCEEAGCPGDNPSTGVYRLTECIRAGGRTV
ncbi:MAG TPA: RloB family protein [Thermoanaerobaculia bacterium]|nr:RloB family protein [Thermoanaerobaculia bacterium]